MNELIQMGTVLEREMMSAADMTHALCALGGGSMWNGIQTVELEGFLDGFDECKRESRLKTTIACTACVAGGAAVTGLIVWGVKKHRAKKRAKAKQM